MKRSNFTISSILIAVFILAIALPARAQLSLSGGISITEMTPTSGIFSHVDAIRQGEIIGSWFSTSGTLPVLVKDSTMSYEVYGDFPGISKIERVTLTCDGGATQWPAKLVPGKGWCVQVPLGMQNTLLKTKTELKDKDHQKVQIVKAEWQKVTGLEAGGYSFEWCVWSKDKSNRLMLIIIPISWSSVRKSSGANHTMVQAAPKGFCDLSNPDAFGYLRGFITTQATSTQQPTQTTTTVIPTGGGVTPAVGFVPPQGGSNEPPKDERPPKVETDNNRHPLTGQVENSVHVDGYVKVGKVPSETRRVSRVTITILKDGRSQVWRNQLIDLSHYHVGQIVEFRDDCNKLVGAAEVVCTEGELKMEVFKGNLPDSNNLWVVVEGGDK